MEQIILIKELSVQNITESYNIKCLQQENANQKSQIFSYFYLPMQKRIHYNLYVAIIINR